MPAAPRHASRHYPRYYGFTPFLQPELSVILFFAYARAFSQRRLLRFSLMAFARAAGFRGFRNIFAVSDSSRFHATPPFSLCCWHFFAAAIYRRFHAFADAAFSPLFAERFDDISSPPFTSASAFSLVRFQACHADYALYGAYSGIRKARFRYFRRGHIIDADMPPPAAISTA